MNLQNKTILFQGDSITDMNHIWSPVDQNHLYGHSFVFLLASQLGYCMPGAKIHIENRGISGNRTNDLADRWERDSLSLSPDIINILVGINDRFDAAEYKRLLAKIIEDTHARLPETQFILCEPFVHIPSYKGEDKDNKAEKVRLHQAALREVAEKYGCLFVPLQKVFDDAYRSHPEVNDTYWIWDGIHPTAAGHMLIARQWLACVENHI